MRRALIAGNWKMYKTPPEAVALVEEIGRAPRGAPLRTCLVAPPFTVAASRSWPRRRAAAVAVAAQNMHFEKEGAFTGEVSAAMLKDVGVAHVILGHSERRQYFGETDEGVAKKTKVALDNGLLPISAWARRSPSARRAAPMEVVGRQVDAILNAVSADEAKKVVIAYEPVWAIGTGKVATPGAGAGGPRLHPHAHRARSTARRWPTRCASSTAAASSPTTSRA